MLRTRTGLLPFFIDRESSTFVRFGQDPARTEAPA